MINVILFQLFRSFTLHLIYNKCIYIWFLIRLDKVRQNYQMKTRNMEKFELDKDSQLLGIEIKRFEKKLLHTPFVPMVKIVS